MIRPLKRYGNFNFGAIKYKIAPKQLYMIIGQIWKNEPYRALELFPQTQTGI